MTKASDIDDLLGKAKPVKKVPAKKAEAAPAKKTATKKAEAAAPAKKAPAKKAEAAPAKKAREPMHFAEGERQSIYDGVTAHFKKSKKPIGSRDLAEKLGVETRKLRVALYSMAKKAEPIIALSLEGSKVGGMTVSPA